MILDAGRRLDARRHVDAEGPHARNGLADVVGRQPAGQQRSARVRGYARSGGPVERRARCRRAAPDRARRAAASRSPARPPTLGILVERVDTALMTGRGSPPANATLSSPCSWTAPRPTTATTSAIQSAGWFTNTPTGVTNGGSVADDRARAVRIDEPRALGQKTKPSASRAASTAASRVLQARDAADLDEHHVHGHRIVPSLPT